MRKLLLLLLFLLLHLQPASGEQLQVLGVVKGSYLDYYPSSLKGRLVAALPLYFYDWVGKLYARKNGLDENGVLRRAFRNAGEFCRVISSDYLKRKGVKLRPRDYFIIIDHYRVDFSEDELKFSTVITGNCLLFKR